MGEKISFANTRARIQRLTDARILNGWVQQITADAITVSVQPEVELELQQGEKLHFEIQGNRLLGMVQGSYVGRKGDLYHFQFCSAFKTTPSCEDVRFRVKGLTGSVIRCPSAASGILSEIDPGQTRSIFCQVMDLSMEGLGIETEEPLRQGEIVMVEIESAWGRLQCQAEVRYCKPGGIGFRAGLKHTAMDRLNRSIYQKLLDSLGY